MARASKKLTKLPMCHDSRSPHTNTDEDVREGLSRILHDELHWLDIPRLRVREWHSTNPTYIMDLHRAVYAIEGRSRLCAAARGHLDIQRSKLSTYGKGTFSYAGPSARNSLPNYAKDRSLTYVVFKRSLKTFLFSK